MKKLNEVKWKAFKVGELFDIKRPSARNKDDYQAGDIFFVASGAANNGVMKCCAPKVGEVLDNGNCITISPVDGTCFYQPADFLGRGGAGSSILLLYHKDNILNQYTGLFLSRALYVATSQYSYGRMATADSIRKTLFLLPATHLGQPDYDFMEQYMKNLESKLLLRYKYFLDSIHNKQRNSGFHKKDKSKFANFIISELFDIQSGVRLVKDEMKDGSRPFIGATDSNNGITAFCSNTNKSLDSNVLGVNYNGSVVENFYHPYQAIFSDDVKRMKLKDIEGNRYIYLYIKNALLKQKCKYQYGYKFNGERMSKQSIILPITSKCTPDYAYMENYMRAKETEIIQRYINTRLKDV